MSNTQYAVCHLQRGSGNDSGMSCHIERKDAKGKIYVPDNANADRTHLNRELVRFPEGVSNRTEAIQHRIDTAGLRKKAKVTEDLEFYSVLRSIRSIESSDVCILMLDATAGIEAQDLNIFNLVVRNKKGCVIVVNKWDLVEKDGKTMDKMREDIRRDLSYMTYAPILFISAATGQRVPRLFELINYVHSQACTRITTGMLNNVLEDAQTRVQPPTDKGKRLKIYYMTQVGVCPPHFVIFCNDRQLFHFSYQRYIENCIRNVFGLEGTPIILSIRQKGDKEE